MAFSTFYHDLRSRNLLAKGQAGAALTGTLAAGLAADGVIWTLRSPELTQGSGLPGASRIASPRLFVERIHLHVTTGTAFTTPVTLGRGLKLVRGSPTSGNTASDPSGGAAYVMVRKRSDITATEERLAVGRVATTAALTTTGFTFESAPLRRFTMAHVGASGADYDEVWVYDGREADPIVLLPGQVLALAAASTFDADGTFECAVCVDAVEVS